MFARMADSTAPPHDLDAERALLGALLINPAAIASIIPLVTPGVFYREAHRFIFAAMLRCYRDDVAADYITLCAQLRKDGTLDDVGGADSVVDLASAVPTPFHVEHYAKQVNTLARRRALVAIATDMVAQAYDDTGDIGPLVEGALGRMERIALDAHAGNGLVALEDIEPYTPRFLIDPIVLRDDVNLLSGPGASGKTRLVLSLLSAVASGGYVMGHPDLQPEDTGRGVLLTGGEERVATLRWMDPTAKADIIEITEKFTLPEGDLTAYAHWHLRRLSEQERPLVILDSISNLYLASENDRRHVNRFISQLRHYAYQGMAIVMIGHVSRAHSDWSGSTAWTTGVRSHITLTRDEKDPDVAIISLIKANRAKAGQTFRVTNVDESGRFVPWRPAEDEVKENPDTDGDKVEKLLQVLVQDLGVPRSGTPKPITQAAIAEAMGASKRELSRLIESAEAIGRLGVFRADRGTWEYLVP